MSYDQNLDQVLDEYLLDIFGPEFFKPGLDRITDCFKTYQDIFKSKEIKIITIAGTNGKGETSHFLNDLLVSQGKKTALWTSPHVLSVTERYKFSNSYIEHKELLELFKCTEARKLSLSYYEFLFCCFCEKATQLDLDYIILEVGLGGRLDTTNLIDTDLSLLCSISRDHEEYLGSDLCGILHEKLGITRANAFHISALEGSFLRSEQDKFLAIKEVTYKDLFSSNLLQQEDHFSKRNRLLACAAYLYLNGEKVELEGLFELEQKTECTESKGRMENVTFGEIKFIFIGAHNIDGIRKTVQYLADSKLDKSSGLICAFSKRPVEDIQVGLKIFESAKCLWKTIYVSEFTHPKAFSFRDHQSDFKDLELVEWEAIIDNLILENKGQWIVAGSYYFIGEVQKFLHSRIPHLEL